MEKVVSWAKSIPKKYFCEINNHLFSMQCRVPKTAQWLTFSPTVIVICLKEWARFFSWISHIGFVASVTLKRGSQEV